MAKQEDKRQPSINIKKATGRPQRAAALTRTYREMSDSDNQSSLSESEKAPPPKACGIQHSQFTGIFSSYKCLYLRPSGSRQTSDNGPNKLYVFVFFWIEKSSLASSSASADCPSSSHRTRRKERENLCRHSQTTKWEERTEKGRKSICKDSGRSEEW